MAGKDKQEQQQTQSSQTNPWAPAQPLLQDLISKYSGLDTGVTSGQRGAVDELMSSASGLPNFGTQGADAVSKFFGSSTAPQLGMLSDAFSGLNKNIGATASGENLDPYSTPGFGDAINTTMNDITNRVKGVYAGSGRDPSGAGTFAKSLGRGLTEGVAPTIAAEAGKLRGEQQTAANTLYNAGNTTAGQTTQQEQVPLANSAQGFNLAGMLSSLFTNPAQTKLAAANTGYQLPLGNLGALLQPATALGGLGSQSSGNSTTTQTTQQNPMSNIIGGISSGIGLLSFLSDPAVKDDIQEVGKLHDGQKIYRYRYKGEDATRIGLLAPEVLKTDPDAIGMLGKFMTVNYKTATDRAARMAA